ncbi:MAG TPA: ATP-binding protein [Polyangiaceae bacterium]|nr:ATP-binding protein [Polyangiaceae bacterium]
MRVEIQRQLAWLTKEEASVAARYVFSLGVALAALLLTLLLSRTLEGINFLIVLTAIMMSSLYGGLGPALAATGFSVAAFCPIVGEGWLGPAQAAEAYWLGLFGLVATLVSFIGSSVRSARIQLEVARRDAEEAVDNLLASEGARAALVVELREALRTRDEFLSIASHELKTPLTSLELQVESLERALARDSSKVGSPEKVGQKLAVIERQVVRLTELINNLLDVSVIMSGRMKMQVEKMELGQLVTDVLDRLRDPLASAKCEVSVDLKDQAWGLWDSVRMEAVVMNLLFNAMKFGRGKPISITLRTVAGKAELSVRDEGIGIARADQSRIFERFERAVPEQYGGMGVGLWIVRRTVEALGGSVRVESEPEKGATFTVSLPRAVSTSAPPPAGMLGRFKEVGG